MEVEKFRCGEWLGRAIGAGVEELAGDAAAEEDGEGDEEEETESVAAGSARRGIGGGRWHGRSGARMGAGGNWETTGGHGLARMGGGLRGSSGWVGRELWARTGAPDFAGGADATLASTGELAGEFGAREWGEIPAGRMVRTAGFEPATPCV